MSSVSGSVQISTFYGLQGGQVTVIIAWDHAHRFSQASSDYIIVAISWSSGYQPEYYKFPYRVTYNSEHDTCGVIVQVTMDQHGSMVWLTTWGHIWYDAVHLSNTQLHMLTTEALVANKGS